MLRKRRIVTSKRTRTQRAVSRSAAVTAVPDLPIPGSDVLRRVLMVFLTMILVARPLVGGEDPGLRSAFSDPSSLSLILLSLVAFAAWGGWRIYTNQPAIYHGAVDYALLALCLLLAAGVGQASYRRPALLAGYEWLGLGLLLVLVRQLSVRPEEKQGILCVLLASAVALSAQGTYQAIRDIPRARHQAEQTNGIAGWVREEANKRGVNPSALEQTQMESRLEARQVFGPYFHPESLAAILVLCLPVLIAGFVASIRGGASPWQTIAVGACALLVGVIIVLTGVRAALGAFLAVCVGAACLVWPGRLSALVRSLAISLAAGTLALVAAAGLLETPLDRTREVWPAAWRMFEEHFWLGSGPAQFALRYPRYMAETAGVPVTEPSNLFLELGIAGGIGAVVAALVGIVLFIRAVSRWRRQELEAIPAESTVAPVHVPPSSAVPVRWEFYLGGMVGLVMAFLFRGGSLPPSEIMGEALRIGVHAVVWFGAFALFEGIAWSEGEFVGSLCAGLAAMLLLFVFENGVGYPSVSAYLWVCAGLVLAVVAPRPAAWLSRQAFARALPVPVGLALAFAFFAFVCYPMVSSATTIHEIQIAGGTWIQEITSPRKARKLIDPSAFIRRRIIDPLQLARKDDPDNVRLMTELSAWYGQLWELAPDDKGLSDLSVNWAHLAQRANPEGPAGYRVEFDVRIRVCSVLQRMIATLEKDLTDKKMPAKERDRRRPMIARLKAKRQEQFLLAARALAAYLPHDPTNPVVHQQRAFALYQVGSPDADAKARKAALEARRLDGLVKPPRTLSDPQRKQLEEWLGKESVK